MKSPEMCSVTPENNNAKFIDKFSGFGIDDQKMINELLGYGEIVEVNVFDDSLEIFYKTGKHEKVVVRKSEVKIINPKSSEVAKTRKHFAIDLSPERDYADRFATPRNNKKYPDHERQTSKDLVDMTRGLEEGKIIEN